MLVAAHAHARGCVKYMVFPAHIHVDGSETAYAYRGSDLMRLSMVYANIP